MGRQTPDQMAFGRIYPLLVSKAQKKGRSQEEVDTVICWLTGYSPADLAELAETGISYGDFFRQAPHLNDARLLIRGTVCGVRVEEVQDPLLREMRYLDKLIDELARERPWTASCGNDTTKQKEVAARSSVPPPLFLHYLGIRSWSPA